MTATLTPPIIRDETSYSVVMYDMSWKIYEALLDEIGDQNIRITYDEGALELMPPRSAHEGWKKIIGGLIEVMAVELNIPMCRLGSTTFKRQDLAKGVEPDECYYVQRERMVRGVNDIDLKHNPPPDLVVEVDVSHLTISKRSIYAAMGVPEVWRFDGEVLETFHLDQDGKYRASDKSLAFPFLHPVSLLPFIQMSTDIGETTRLRSWRDWVAKNLPTRT